MTSRRSAPFWFLLLVAVAVAAAARLAVAYGIPLYGAVDGGPRLEFAFWAIFVTIAQIIWNGVQAAAAITAQVLVWMVQILWQFAIAIAQAAATIASYAWKGLKVAWGFLKSTYTHVLKPAWKFVWKWIEKTERWLKEFFGPILKTVRWLREHVLKFYNDYVKPILDLIGIGRQVLRVLGSFGIEWAKALDRRLADLEDRINAPFQYVIGKLNEVVNVVNRIVTLDGLFQRLYLIRSIERDVKYVVNAWHNSQSKPLTDEDRQAALARDKYKTGAQIIEETRVYIETGDGPRASAIDEWSQQLERNLATR